MFGRSLSLCIEDIANGKVKESDVDAIVTSTRIRSKPDFNDVIARYKKSYWHDNPELAHEIALRLWNTDKIIQPRLNNNNLVQSLYKYPIWCNSLQEAMESLEEF